MLSVDDRNTRKKNKYLFHTILFLIVLLAGMQNSGDYLRFMGFDMIVTTLEIIFYLLLFLTCYLLILKNLLHKERLAQESISFLPFCIGLILAILLKFIILFIQDYTTVLPGGENFSSFFNFGINFMLMIFIASTIKELDTVKVAIWGLGLGAVLSTIIPILFFPEMIGSRAIEVRGYSFTGGFWNSSVISFISIGWLAIALANLEKTNWKKGVLVSIFVLVIFGGSAGLSRAILVSVIFSVLVYLILAKKFKKYIKVIVAIIISLFLIINLFPDLYSNFSERLEGGIDIQDETRTAIWLDYLEDLPSYVLFGAIDGDHRKFSTGNYGPHSVILNWLVQYGIIGLVGFILLILGLLKSISEIKRKNVTETTAALYAWLIAYLTLATINETGFSQLTVFAAFGIIFGWGKICASGSKSRFQQ